MIRLGSDNKIWALKEVMLYDNLQMKYESLLKRSSRNYTLPKKISSYRCNIKA